MKRVSTPEFLVRVVDDDEAVRSSLKLLLKSAGLTTSAYASAAEFLAAHDDDQPGCLVLDIRMPGMDGLELQDELNRRGAMIPVIFITGHGDLLLGGDMVIEDSLLQVDRLGNVLHRSGMEALLTEDLLAAATRISSRVIAPPYRTVGSLSIPKTPTAVKDFDALRNELDEVYHELNNKRLRKHRPPSKHVLLFVLKINCEKHGMH